MNYILDDAGCTPLKIHNRHLLPHLHTHTHTHKFNESVLSGPSKVKNKKAFWVQLYSYKGDFQVLPIPKKESVRLQKSMIE